MRTVAKWMDRRQVSLYLTSLAVGAAVGLLIPAVAQPAAHAISPVLGPPPAPAGSRCCTRVCWWRWCH